MKSFGYGKKSNNIHELNSHIWDQWADENGTIEKHMDTKWVKSMSLRQKME